MRTAERALAALETHPLLEGLSRQERRLLRDCGEVVTYAPGDFLSREGQPADWYWLLLSGSVRVYYSSPEGLEVTVKVFRAPAAWAEMEVLSRHPHIENCVAVDRSVVLRIPQPAFEDALEKLPRFMRNVLHDTCARFLIAAQHERALAFLPVETRLANLLMMYLRMYGVPVKDGVAIRVKLSHSSLANDLGVAQRSVARTMTAWQREGLVGKSGVHYVVRELPKLTARANQDIVGIDWIAGTRLSEGRGVRRR